MDSKTHLNDYVKRNAIADEVDINYSNSKDDIKYVSFKDDGGFGIRPGENYFIDISKNGSKYPVCDIGSLYKRLGYYHSEIVIAYVSGCVVNSYDFFCLSSVWDESYRSTDSWHNMFALHEILNQSGYYKFTFDQFNAAQFMRLEKYVPFSATPMFGADELLNPNSDKMFTYFSNGKYLKLKDTVRFFKHLSGGYDNTITFEA